MKKDIETINKKLSFSLLTTILIGLPCTLGMAMYSRQMLNLLFTILMIMVFGKLIGFAIRAAWGISKVIVTLVFLPLILIGLVLGGLIYLALPILIVVGLVALFKGFD